MKYKVLTIVPNKIYIKIEYPSTIETILSTRYKDFIITQMPKNSLLYTLFQRKNDCDRCLEKTKINFAGFSFCINFKKFFLCYCCDPVNIYVIDSVLRICTTIILSYNNGCLLHSTGIVRNVYAILFCGPSGAGKSTIAKQVSDMKVLSDEICPVIFVDDKIYTWRSMFYSEVVPNYSQLRLLQVKEICFISRLRKSIYEVKKYNLSTDEAIEMLLKNILWFIDEPVLTKRLFTFATKILKKVRFYLCDGTG